MAELDARYYQFRRKIRMIGAAIFSAVLLSFAGIHYFYNSPQDKDVFRKYKECAKLTKEQAEVNPDCNIDKRAK